jgi:hypothetical protein
MPPKYKKDDYVKVLATAFDNEKRDKAGRNFSEDWLHQGNGIWCYGTISRVYVKRGRQPQKYSIKYDGGQSMAALEGQIEPANEDDEEDADGEENARDEMYDSDRDSDNQSTDSYETDNIGWEDRVRETELTDESEGECEGEEKERGDTIDMGETVVCGADDDPQRRKQEYNWNCWLLLWLILFWPAASCFLNGNTRMMTRVFFGNLFVT